MVRLKRCASGWKRRLDVVDGLLTSSVWKPCLARLFCGWMVSSDQCQCRILEMNCNIALTFSSPNFLLGSGNVSSSMALMSNLRWSSSSSRRSSFVCRSVTQIRRSDKGNERHGHLRLKRRTASACHDQLMYHNPRSACHDSPEVVFLKNLELLRLGFCG